MKLFNWFSKPANEQAAPVTPITNELTASPSDAPVSARCSSLLDSLEEYRAILELLADGLKTETPRRVVSNHVEALATRDLSMMCFKAGFYEVSGETCLQRVGTALKEIHDLALTAAEAWEPQADAHTPSLHFLLPQIVMVANAKQKELELRQNHA